MINCNAQNDKYLIAVVCSFILMVISRGILADRYRSEVKLSDTTQETIKVIGKSSGAFFFEDNKTIVYTPVKIEENGNEEPSSQTKIHVHGPECKGLPGHDHEEHEGEHRHDEEGEDSKISPGLALMMKQLGFAEMAASLLWIQMDADSHKELWHRVDFELELIPALDPTFIEGFLLRSFIMAHYRQDWQGAIYVLEKAVKQVDNRIDLYEQLGLFCFNARNKYGPKRELEKALKAYIHAAKFVGSPSYNARFVAMTLAAMGKQEKAIDVVEELLKDEERQKDEHAHALDLKLLERLKRGEKF